MSLLSEIKRAMAGPVNDREYRCRECSGELDVVDTGSKIIVDLHDCKDWTCPKCDAFRWKGSECRWCNPDDGSE